MLEFIVWGLYAVVLFITIFLLIVLLDDGHIISEIEWLDEWPKASLVIPAYNEEGSIAMTIESALAIEYPRDKLEIIVVNDGSNDNTKKETEPYSEEYDIVELINQENQGKGAALNTGLERANGKYLACVDADSKLEENSLKNIVSEFDEDTGAVASAMKVYEPKSFLQKLQWLEYMVGIFLRNVMSIINAIHVTPGPLSIYRKKVVEDLGGFDEKSLVEDQEICFRLQKNNWGVKHSRKGEVHTIAPKTLKAFYNQRLRWYRGSIENIIKYKEMILNKAYGDFGMFALPTKLLQGILSILAMIIIIYYILQPLKGFIENLMLLGWQGYYIALTQITISSLFTSIYWFLISWRVMTVFLIFSMFFVSLITAYMAAIHTEENLFEYGILPTIVYLFWYVLFVGFMWLATLIDIIRNPEGAW